MGGARVSKLFLLRIQIRKKMFSAGRGKVGA